MKRSFGIDLVRTLSITLVMARHYGFTQGFNYGYYAIEFLFVVSGFLIGQILFKDFLSSELVEPASVKKFMMRRWFRILPLYYLAIFLRFVVDPTIGFNIFYYVFFLQNHFYGVTFFPETWTLVIDEWFYLGTPLILFFFMRFVSMKRNFIFFFLVGIIVVINILRVFWVYYSNTHYEGLIGNVPLRQDTLLIGVLLAFVKIRFRNIFNKMNTIPVFLFCLFGLVSYILVIYFIRTPVDTINNYFWTRTINFTMASLLIASTLPYIENSVLPLKFQGLSFVNNMVLWGSKMSYALYLFHSDSYRLAKFLSSSFINIPPLLIKLSAVIVSIFISYFLYQYFEKKFLVIRDKYFPD